MIKKIYELFKDISESHLFIKTFKYEDMFEFQKSESIEYPMMILENGNNSINYNKGVTSITLSFYILDLPSESYEDYLEIINKTEEILYDVILKLDLTKNTFYETSNINSIEFKEWNSNNVAGWRTDVTFKILKTDRTLCQAPIV